LAITRSCERVIGKRNERVCPKCLPKRGKTIVEEGGVRKGGRKWGEWGVLAGVGVLGGGGGGGGGGVFGCVVGVGVGWECGGWRERGAWTSALGKKAETASHFRRNVFQR